MWGGGLMGKSPTLAAALAVSSLVLVNSAPVDDWNSNSELAFPDDGCYYQYRHYNEGDQIITNEPCLNCTCHNQMLMCFLRVCPFIKPVGKNCIVEKNDDQCCPTISCPPVPVDIWTSTPLPPALISSENEIGTDISMLPMSNNPGGCDIDGQFYMDGMKIPSDPSSPCDLCYCIRNHTACVMQECVLKVEGCEPIYMDGICCPVKYICEDGSVFPGLPGLESDEESTDMTVVPPKPTQPGCYNAGQFYANGADIVTEDPCEHCYCLNGDVVCAIQECMGPLEGKTDNCQALPPPPGQCCPAEYKCNPVTTLAPLTEQPQTVASVAEPELSTVMPTMTPTEEEKLDEGTENNNVATTVANVDITGDETTQKSQETSTSEIQDDDLESGAEFSTENGAELSTESGAEISTEIPEEIEATSVGQIISDALGSVGSTISSIFGTSSDTQDDSEDKIDSAETEKSPIDGQLPGTLVQDIEDSLDQDRFEETTDRIDESTIIAEDIVETGASEVNANEPEIEQTTAKLEFNSDKVNGLTTESTEVNVNTEQVTQEANENTTDVYDELDETDESTTVGIQGEIQYDDNDSDDYDYENSEGVKPTETESPINKQEEELTTVSFEEDIAVDSGSVQESEENVSVSSEAILSTTEAVTSALSEDVQTSEDETPNNSPSTESNASSTDDESATTTESNLTDIESTTGETGKDDVTETVTQTDSPAGIQTNAEMTTVVSLENSDLSNEDNKITDVEGSSQGEKFPTESNDLENQTDSPSTEENKEDEEGSGETTESVLDTEGISTTVINLDDPETNESTTENINVEEDETFNIEDGSGVKPTEEENETTESVQTEDSGNTVTESNLDLDNKNENESANGSPTESITSVQDGENEITTVSTIDENDIESDTAPQEEISSGDNVDTQDTTESPVTSSSNEGSGSEQAHNANNATDETEIIAATESVIDEENEASTESITGNQDGLDEVTTISAIDETENDTNVSPQEESASTENSNSQEATEDPIFTTEVSCDQVTCSPPAGFEFCEPLPVREGLCCPEQYECNTETTTGPSTVIVTTEGAIIEDVFEESSGAPTELSVNEDDSSSATEETFVVDSVTESINEIDGGVTEIDSSITTDATASVQNLMTDNKTCTDSNGAVYENLEDVPGNDVCQLCQCSNGEILCAVEECRLPEPYYDSCKPLPVKDGKCCPEYSCELPDASTTYAPDQTETESSVSEGSTQTNVEEETTTQTGQIQFDDADDEYDEVTEINNQVTESGTESDNQVQEGTTVLNAESQEDVTDTVAVTESVDLQSEDSSEGLEGSSQTEQEATTSETESTTGGSFVDSILEYDELTVPQQGSLEEDTDDTNITTESSAEENSNTDQSNELDQDVTNSDIETTTAEILGDINLEYDELTVPQQGSLEEDIEDNNTTTESAIEEAGNTDSSTESEQDVTASDIEATTAGIVGDNILEYDELTQEGDNINASITTESAIDEAGNTDPSVESDQDTTISGIETSTAGINEDTTPEYDELTVPQQGSLEEDTNAVNENIDVATESEQDATESDIEATTPVFVGEIIPEYDEVTNTQQGSAQALDGSGELTSQDKIDESSTASGNLETTTKPEEGGLTTSDTLLCLVLGMENCVNKPGQNNSLAQTEGNDKQDNVILNSGECLYEGKIYQDFEDVETSNPCNLCYCSFGEVICAERECLPPTGYEFCEPLPAQEGECCPEQYECNVSSSTGQPATTVVVTVKPQSGPVGPDGSLATTANPFVNIEEIKRPGTVEDIGPPSPPTIESLTCIQDGLTYENNSVVPTVDKCDMSCYCVEGDIECDRLPCHPAPEGMNCTEVYEEGECCPSIQCIGEELPKPGSDSHIFEEYSTEDAIPTETTESSSGVTEVADIDSATEIISEQQDVDEITSVGTDGDDVELTTTSLDLNEIGDVEVVTSPLEETEIKETATSDSKLDNEKLTTAVTESVEELTENEATTAASINKETTHKTNMDTEEAITEEASTEEASTEEAITEEIGTTTSQGEIQFDDADEYGDDSFFDSCNYNGSVYENFEDVPSGDPCQLCQCFEGDVICAERECITPSGYENCRPLPATDGACCPSSWECDDNIETFTETVSTTQSVIETTASSQEQTTGLAESPTELPSNIESDTTAQIDNEQESESATAVTSEDFDANVVTESINNIDEATDKETLTTTINIEESQTETSQSLGEDLEESSGLSEITTTSSSSTNDSENQTESSTDIIDENVTSSESENGENQTTETITSQENEESNIISTTENDLHSLPEAECDPTTCTAPSGYEFCQPLPVEEGECCPSQYECNVSTTTDGPTTTVVVSVTEDDSDMATTTENILDTLPEAPCDPTACPPPSGYEFCQPLPVQEGECCPTQYECNVSTTTDEPVTTVVVTVSEGSVTTKQPSTDSSVVTSEASQTEISSDNETQTDSATELVDSDESGFGSTTFDGSDVQEITTESSTFPESSSVESVTSLLTGSEENESTSEDESNPTTLSNAEEVTTTQTIVETEKQETATDSESGETTTETASEQTEDNVTENITDTVEDLSIETVTEVDAITESEEGSVNTEASAETVTEVDSATERVTDPSVTEVDAFTESEETATEVDSVTEADADSDNTDEETVTELGETVTETVSETEEVVSETSSTDATPEETVAETEVVTESEDVGMESIDMQSATEVNSEDIATVSQELETVTESEDSATEETATETVSQESVMENVSEETASHSEFDNKVTESASSETATEGNTEETGSETTEAGLQETVTETEQDSDLTETQSTTTGEEAVTATESNANTQETDTESAGEEVVSEDNGTESELEDTVTEASSNESETEPNSEETSTDAISEETATETEQDSNTQDTVTETESATTTEEAVTATDSNDNTQETEVESTGEEETGTESELQQTVTEAASNASETEVSSEETATGANSEETATEIVSQTTATDIDSGETPTEEGSGEPATEAESEETVIDVEAELEEITTQSELEDNATVSDSEDTVTESISQESETEGTDTDSLETDSEETATETGEEEAAAGNVAEETETDAELEGVVSEQTVTENENEEVVETTDESVTDSDILQEEDILTQETSNTVDVEPEAGSNETETTAAPLSDIDASQSPLIESGDSSSTETTASNIEQTVTENESIENEEVVETTDESVTDADILQEEDVLTQETSNKVDVEPEAGSNETETTAAPLSDIDASQSPLIESGDSSSTETTASSIEETSSKKPSMKFCLHKGMIIQNLADVPSKDACQLCQCVEGEIICATQECTAAPQEGCVKIVEEGECCPKYNCDESTDETTASSGEVDLIKTTDSSAEIQDDDIGDYDEGEDEIILELPTTTLKPAPSTTFRPITSSKPVSTTQLTTLLTTTLAQEGLVTTVTPAGINQNDDGTFGTASGTSLDNDEYIDFDLESIGPGACLFENKIYVSAQQIPRDNPCDFCFCFRGDIICLQQSCPPPIPGCTEEIISGFCCPRYECPVKMSFHNVTKHITHATEPPSIASWFGWGAQQPQQEEEIYSTEVKGCEVQGEFYETGAIVTASSGPCLQCRCDYNEKLDCEPQDCETQPLIKRMMENFR